MPGAGNLGDDLISVLLAKAILDRWPAAELGILHAGLSNPFEYPSPCQIRLLRTPSRRSLPEYLDHLQAIKEFVRTSDLILIGGGGLFQDSHYPFTVHEWLRDALRTSRKRIPVAAVGVGFGPLNLRFSRWYLKHGLGRLAEIQVRDEQSAEIVRSLGHETTVAPDIVAGSDLSDSLFGIRLEPPSKQVLGCSIRPWPGLDVAATLHLIRIASESTQSSVRLFAFEHADPHDASEYEFAMRLAKGLEENGVSTEVWCYRKQPIEEFARAFGSVTLAIAARFHANILWQKMAIPVLPIAYAPKVARLYEERGGRVLDVNDVEARVDLSLFQSIPITEKYHLPEEEALFGGQYDTSRFLGLLGRAVSTTDMAYDVGRRVGWRLKRLRTRMAMGAGFERGR